MAAPRPTAAVKPAGSPGTKTRVKRSMGRLRKAARMHPHLAEINDAVWWIAEACRALNDAYGACAESAKGNRETPLMARIRELVETG